MNSQILYLTRGCWVVFNMMGMGLNCCEAGERVKDHQFRTGAWS